MSFTTKHYLRGNSLYHSSYLDLWATDFGNTFAAHLLKSRGILAEEIADITIDHYGYKSWTITAFIPHFGKQNLNPVIKKKFPTFEALKAYSEGLEDGMKEFAP